jgi:hypothetical protein
VSDSGESLDRSRTFCSLPVRITFIIVYKLPHCMLCLEDATFLFFFGTESYVDI